MQTTQSAITDTPPNLKDIYLPLRASHWWSWAIRGLAALAFGVLTFVWPGATIASLILVFGFYAVMDGVFAFIEAIKRRHSDKRWWALLLESLAGLALGAIALLMPGLVAFSFVYLLGVWAIVTGVLEIVQAIRARHEIQGEGWLILGGVLSVLFGGTLVIWPDSGAIALIWLLGGYAIGFGLVMLIMAFNLRKGRATPVAAASVK